MDELTAAAGLHLGNSTERALLGILAGAAGAQRELARFGSSAQQEIRTAVHDSFVFGIANVMWLSTGLAIASAVFTAVVMRPKQPPAEDALVKEPDPSAA
jgi:hypothetical protein